MNTKNARITGVDFVKGICIILVVLVHSIAFSSFPPLVEKIFQAVFLNSFFAVSGFMVYQYNQKITKNTFGVMLHKRFRSLIVPYVSFSILAILWHIFLCVGLDCREVSESYFGWTLILRDVFCMVSGLGIGTLWFLPVLFLSYALLLFTLLVTDSVKSKPAILLCLLIASGFFASFLENANLEKYFSGMIGKVISEYTYTTYRVINGYAFALFGYLLHMIYPTDKKKMWAILAGLCAVCFLPGLENFGATGILLLGSIFLFCENTVNGFLKYPVHFLIYCGKHSLAITIYHYIFLLPLEVMLLKALGFTAGWLSFWVNLTSTLVVVYFLERNPTAQFLLTGKKPNSKADP